MHILIIPYKFEAKFFYSENIKTCYEPCAAIYEIISSSADAWIYCLTQTWVTCHIQCLDIDTVKLPLGAEQII